MGFKPCVALGSGVRAAGHAGCWWECAGAVDKDEGLASVSAFSMVTGQRLL